MKIEGLFKEVIFRNEENGYTVGLFSTEDGEIVCVGHFSDIRQGAIYQMEGDLVFHEKYGEQFKVSSAFEKRPTNEGEIVNYLSSGLFPHIGRRMAERIYDRFGEKSLDIMEEDIDRLKEVPGIGEKKLFDIKERAKEVLKNRETIIFLQNLGLTNSQAMKIYSMYGSSTVDNIKANPYGLIGDIPGMGFKSADKLALENDMKKDSPERISAGVIYTLSFEAKNYGHCYLPQEEVLEKAAGLLGLDQKEVSSQLDYMELTGKITREVFSDQTYCYLDYIFKAENSVAGKIAQLLNEEATPLSFSDPIEKLEDLGLYIDLSEEQKKAIEMACRENLLIITGGPGTGKTTIIRELLKLFEYEDMRVLLCAPTGRAAKRMEESTGEEAQTIHRLLGFNGSDENYGIEHDSSNPLEADSLIVDEVSMVDINLMALLMDALPNGCRLILVGDSDQLPPVGPGNVLHDLITSGLVPSVSLKRVYRQDEGSMIAINAHRINQGKLPKVNGKNSDFFFMQTKTPDQTRDLVLDLVKERLPKAYAFGIDDIQILAPMKKGPAGVDQLNLIVRDGLNPGRDSKGGFRRGDKVMQLRNNYDIGFRSEEKMGTGIYNGDIGRILAIDDDEELIKIEVDDKIYTYRGKERRDLALSYAMTIHKSQGSEFPCVILALEKAYPLFLTRNLLYTAVTRAKKLLIIVGSLETLKIMIKNKRVDQRRTSLDLMIKNYLKEYRMLYG